MCADQDFRGPDLIRPIVARSPRWIDDLPIDPGTSARQAFRGGPALTNLLQPRS